MIIEEKLSVELWNTTKCVSYYVNCFDRMMYVFFNGMDFTEKEVEGMIDKLYYEWHDNEDDSCCEEYILDYLPKELRDRIVVVAYDVDKEEN